MSRFTPFANADFAMPHSNKKTPAIIPIPFFFNSHKKMMYFIPPLSFDK